MLVLSRRAGEDILIPQAEVEFRVLSIRGASVRIGIKAPRELQIIRKEVLSSPEHAEAVSEALKQAVQLANEKRELHRLRNLLHEVSLTVHTARAECENGSMADVASLLDRLTSSLQQSGQRSQSTDSACQSGTMADCGIRVLLVEDQPNEREMMAHVLRLGGCCVDVAADGFEAVQQAASVTPDVVLMDLNLPGQDGASAAQQIHELPQCSNVPILAVTGHAEDNRADCFTHWLQKPVDPARMLGRVHALATGS